MIPDAARQRRRRHSRGNHTGPVPDGTFRGGLEPDGSCQDGAMPIPSMVSRALRASTVSRPASVRLIVLLVVVALTTGIAATVVTASSLPSCRVADTLTKQRSYAAWNRTVLDTRYRLTSGYYPGDLRSTANAGLNGGHRVRAFVIADLRAMVRAARAAGARLAVQSAFRSYSTQKSTFAYWSRVSGYSAALRSSARAGHSEHQLGTTIDFRSYGGSAPWYYSDWGTTKAGAWGTCASARCSSGTSSAGSGPFSMLPPAEAASATGRHLAHQFAPADGETRAQMIRRSTRAVTDAFKRLSDHDKATEATNSVRRGHDDGN